MGVRDVAERMEVPVGERSIMRTLSSLDWLSSFLNPSFSWRSFRPVAEEEDEVVEPEPIFPGETDFEGEDERERDGGGWRDRIHALDKRSLLSSSSEKR